VFGHPVRHSASPAMHNPALAALGLDWRYLAFDVHPDDLRAAIAGAKVMKFVGLNLTVPHKLLALEMCDALDESARQWGAVNTIRFEAKDNQGQWQPLAHATVEPANDIRSHGFNTDADAIIQSLGEDLDFQVRGQRVTLLGAGGAGRVAALRIAMEGAKELFLVNRSTDRAEALAGEIRKRFPGVQVVPDYPGDGRSDLVLNATSLGLKPDDDSPLDETRLPLSGVGCVYDMIYRPAETTLLRAARAAGRRAANGLGMLLHQGAKALEIWTGKSAPLDIMRRALEKNVYG
jgi:shikimate dehydrogenase